MTCWPHWSRRFVRSAPIWTAGSLRLHTAFASVLSAMTRCKNSCEHRQRCFSIIRVRRSRFNNMRVRKNGPHCFITVLYCFMNCVHGKLVHLLVAYFRAQRSSEHPIVSVTGATEAYYQLDAAGAGYCRLDFVAGHFVEESCRISCRHICHFPNLVKHPPVMKATRLV